MVRDISLQYSGKKPFQKEFNIQTQWLDELYLSCLDKYPGGVYKKVIVDLIEDAGQDGVFDDMVDVFLVKKLFNFDAYFLLDKKEKKRKLLEILQEGLLAIAKHLRWPTSPLEEAYKCCLSKDLEHKGLVGGKYFISPDRNHYAGLFYDWDIDMYEAFVVVLNKKKEEMKRVKLFGSEPYLIEPWGKPWWDKETNEFCVGSKDGRQKWATKINNDN